MSSTVFVISKLCRTPYFADCNPLDFFYIYFFSGKASFIKFFLLAQFPFSHLVFSLDYHGLHLADLAHLMHQKPALQLEGLETTRSSSVLPTTIMTLPALYSTQTMMLSEIFSAKTLIPSFNIPQFSYF